MHWVNSSMRKKLNKALQTTKISYSMSKTGSIPNHRPSNPYLSIDSYIELANIRMVANRFMPRVFFGKLDPVEKVPGGKYKEYRNYAKTILKTCNILPAHLEILTCDRPSWQRACIEALWIIFHFTSPFLRKKRP